MLDLEDIALLGASRTGLLRRGSLAMAAHTDLGQDPKLFERTVWLARIDRLCANGYLKATNQQTYSLTSAGLESLKSGLNVARGLLENHRQVFSAW